MVLTRFSTQLVSSFESTLHVTLANGVQALSLGYSVTIVPRERVSPATFRPCFVKVFFLWFLRDSPRNSCLLLESTLHVTLANGVQAH